MSIRWYITIRGINVCLYGDKAKYDDSLYKFAIFLPISLPTILTVYQSEYLLFIDECIYLSVSLFGVLMSSIIIWTLVIVKINQRR
jgi:hypothetical protein